MAGARGGEGAFGEGEEGAGGLEGEVDGRHGCGC